MRVLGSTVTVSVEGVRAAEGLTESHFPVGGAAMLAWKSTFVPETVTFSVCAEGAGAPVTEDKANEVGLAARTIPLFRITLKVTAIVSGLPFAGVTVTVPV